MATCTLLLVQPPAATSWMEGQAECSGHSKDSWHSKDSTSPAATMQGQAQQYRCSSDSSAARCSLLKRLSLSPPNTR